MKEIKGMIKGIKIILSIPWFHRKVFINERCEASSGFEWKKFTFDIYVNIKTLISFFPILPWITLKKEFFHIMNTSSLGGGFYILVSLKHIYFCLPHISSQ